MAFTKPRKEGDEEPFPRRPAPTQSKAKPKALPRLAQALADSQVIDGDVLSPLSADIPQHVWAMLQEAGEAAAARLLQLLQSPRFADFAPNSQRGLIELALTRAYGLPIRKALNLNLSSNDADAVAASLSDLGQHLPEHLRHALRDTAPQAAQQTQGKREVAPDVTDGGLD